MTKALASFPEHRRESIALRRASGRVRGNGFWSAIAYLDAKGLQIPGEFGRMREIASAVNNAVHTDSAYVQPPSDRKPGNFDRRPPKKQHKSYNRAHANAPRFVKGR